VMNPGLHAALHVHCGCGWVDPAGGNKDECGERPQKHDADDKPSNNGAERAWSRRGLGGWVRDFCHSSE